MRRSGSSLPVSLSSYAVVGAAAFMGGATRLTLTATVMVMETTGSLQLIVPLMLTVFVAKVCLLIHCSCSLCLPVHCQGMPAQPLPLWPWYVYQITVFLARHVYQTTVCLAGLCLIPNHHLGGQGVSTQQPCLWSRSVYQTLDISCTPIRDCTRGFDSWRRSLRQPTD